MKRLIWISSAFVVALIAFTYLTAASTATSNWPQWRGPAGQGISSEKNLPAGQSPRLTSDGRAAATVAHAFLQSCPEREQVDRVLRLTVNRTEAVGV